MKKIYFFALVILLIHNTVFGEIMKLKSSNIIEGRIIEKNGKLIKVNTGIGVNITYYLDEIEKINGQIIHDRSETTSSITLQEKNNINTNAAVNYRRVFLLVDQHYDEFKHYLKEMGNIIKHGWRKRSFSASLTSSRLHNYFGFSMRSMLTRLPCSITQQTG